MLKLVNHNKPTNDSPAQLESKLLSIISHKMRTPLNSIIGFSELLQEGTFGDLNNKQRRYVDNIHLSGTNLLSFADEFIDYLHLKWGEITLDYGKFPVRQIINGAHMMVLDVVDKKNIRITINEDESPCTVHADEVRLTAAFFHLLSNAVRFVSDEGMVIISTAFHKTTPSEIPCAHSGPVITVSIADTGIGIEDEDQANIFDEFYQVHKDMAEDGRRAGLGLWLARELITIQGGVVWVESVRGEGSTFTVALPAA